MAIGLSRPVPSRPSAGFSSGGTRRDRPARDASGGGSVKQRTSGGGLVKNRSYNGGSVKKRRSGGGSVIIYGMQW
ncbi:hypothetical protein IGI04_028552 [Brassica rapa subsp. trilocularis]|uniref:Uncharacterized protein n=1 Tax=Brassica rapa subsp. trilocularis TaxID=1813537 RepID=A0ABQ7L4W1_BRACM|nr:hypothetical protein IGI04_028552 [Brassica rapa subsp. trilocularis]